jgi:hypothetical protein
LTSLKKTLKVYLTERKAYQTFYLFQVRGKHILKNPR